MNGLAPLRAACLAAARGKHRLPGVAAFLLDPAGHLDTLSRELESHAYRPGRGNSFWIHDPKRRRIFALPFRDRVVRHVLIAITLPMLERWFAPQSYACRTGKGTHRCLRRAIELTRVKRFVLRIDVRKFFPSIDHAVLRRLLDPRTPPELRCCATHFSTRAWAANTSLGTSPATTCLHRSFGLTACPSARSPPRCGPTLSSRPWIT